MIFKTQQNVSLYNYKVMTNYCNYIINKMWYINYRITCIPYVYYMYPQYCANRKGLYLTVYATAHCMVT